MLFLHIIQLAVIKVGGAVLSDEKVLTELCDAVTFLKKGGLFPVLIHGGGPQLNDKLESMGIVSDYITGIRITTPKVCVVSSSIFVASALYRYFIFKDL